MRRGTHAHPHSRAHMHAWGQANMHVHHQQRHKWPHPHTTMHARERTGSCKGCGLQRTAAHLETWCFVASGRQAPTALNCAWLWVYSASYCTACTARAPGGNEGARQTRWISVMHTLCWRAAPCRNTVLWAARRGPAQRAQHSTGSHSTAQHSRSSAHKVLLRGVEGLSPQDHRPGAAQQSYVLEPPIWR